MKVLAATSLSGSLLGSTAGASNTTNTSSDVTMNDLEYQLDYDIDRFDGQNVSNSGGVRSESKKYAADSSFVTWQSGTWVNAGADFDSVDTATLEVHQELTADRFNRLARDADRAVERLLLRLASLEYNSGVEMFGTFQEMDDVRERDRAVRHYVTTEALLDVATQIYESYDLD